MVTAKHFKNVGLNLGWRCIQDLLTGATPGCNQQLHPLKNKSATPQHDRGPRDGAAAQMSSNLAKLDGSKMA